MADKRIIKPRVTEAEADILAAYAEAEGRFYSGSLTAAVYLAVANATVRQMAAAVD
jgi:hypothetical protein